MWKCSAYLAPFLLVLTLLVLGACTPKKMSLYEKILRSRRYSSVFKKHTISKGVYSGLETRFIVHATLFAPDFREAFLSEYYNVYYLDEERKEKVRKYIEDESLGKARFVVALYTSNDRINDLEDEKTVWSVFLVTSEETKIRPSEITLVKLNEEEITRFFPYGEKYWYRYYDVQFDIGQLQKELSSLSDPYLKLVMASPVGRAVLVYTP